MPFFECAHTELILERQFLLKKVWKWVELNQGPLHKEPDLLSTRPPDYKFNIAMSPKS